jgi:peptidoglycan/LPS O-acetylase OafA/YrhL
VLAWLLRQRIGWLMAALFLVQMGLARTPMLMMVRTDALALGVLLALFTASSWHARLAPRWLARSAVARLCVLLALLAGMSIFASTAMQNWRFRVSTIALLAAGLVWLASHDAGYLFRVAVVRRLLGWIGARSYAIYLIHVPAYFFLRESCWRMTQVWPAFAPAPWLLVLLAMTLIGMLAEMNYRWVELPLRRHGRRVANAFEANVEEMPRAVVSETA